MSVDTDDAWVPIEDLPVDLQAKCVRSTVDREHHQGRVYRLDGGLVNGGFVVLLIGAVVALFTPGTPGFGNFFRYALLGLGLAFLGVWLALPRTRRFLSLSGQRLVIGPTCLVIVDAEAVRVVSARVLTITPNSVSYGGNVIDDSVHTPGWRADLERAQKAAADPAAVEADRFRTAAARGRRWSSKRVLWMRRVPAIAAGFAGVLLAFILEAGPLHSRAIGGVEAVARARDYERQVEATVTERETLVAAIARDVDAEAKTIARDKLLAIAASGKEDDLRTFLEDAEAEDPARLGIVEKLSALCAAKFPAKALFGAAQLHRRLEGLVCSSSRGTTFDFIYKDPSFQVTTTPAQRVADDLASKLRTTSSVTANQVLSPPKDRPYLELKISKQGPGYAGVLPVKVVATLYDASGKATSEPFTYSTKTTDPSYTPPAPKTPSYGSASDDSDVCPGAITCGYGAGAWCCPLSTRCYPSGPWGQRCVR